MRPFSRPGSQRRFRLVLIILLLITLVPAFGAATTVAFRAASAARTQMEATATQQAHDIVTVLEREMNGNKGSLIALASAQSLQNGDLDAFHEQSKIVSRLLDNQIILTDIRTRRQILNTDAEREQSPGLPLLREDQVEASLLQANNTSIVSDLIFSPITKRYVVAVTMPIRIGGEIRYLLSVTEPASEITDLLSRAQLSAGFITTVTDRNNIVIARSSKSDQFVGKIAPRRDEMSANEEDPVTGLNIEGVPTTFFARRSQLTGWLVSVGVPDELLDSAYTAALRHIALAGSILLTLGLAAAYVGSGQMSRSWGTLGVDRQPTRAEFQVLFDSAGSGALLVDRDGTIVLVNAWMETKFGYTREEMVGRSIELLLPARFVDAHNRFRNLLLARPEAGESKAVEIQGRRKDGTEFPIRIELNPITTKDSTFTMATVIDLTSRKQSAERLSAAISERDGLRRQLLQAQEDERLRLAHELHDETGQALTAALLEIKALEHSINDNSLDRLRRLQRQMEGIGKSLHRVASDLRPAALDELGLRAAIAAHMEEWSEQTGIETDFECDANVLESLPDETRTAIYRVVQESLTNVARHATNAKIVSLVMERNGDVLQLTIEDDGEGFETAAGSDRRGLGIAGMKERVSLIGGSLEVESSPGAGTAVFVRIPSRAAVKSA